MTVEDAVVARLASLTAVTALVGSRIYLDKLPQEPSYPCVRVQLIDEVESYHLRGGGLKTARIQVDACARERSGVSAYGLAATVAAAIHGNDAGSALSGWTDAIGSPAFRIFACLRVDRRRQYDPDELRVVTMSQDYQVTYRA
jgi:hypothetical protein